MRLFPGPTVPQTAFTTSDFDREIGFDLRKTFRNILVSELISGFYGALLRELLDKLDMSSTETTFGRTARQHCIC
jgi:hypothetical protein